MVAAPGGIALYNLAGFGSGGVLGSDGTNGPAQQIQPTAAESRPSVWAMLAAGLVAQDVAEFRVEPSPAGTVQEAIDLDVPAPVLTLALLARLSSRQEESFSAKVIAALRNEFGGHAVKSK